MDPKTFLSYGYVRLLFILALVGVVVALGSYAYLTLKEAKGVYTGNPVITVVGEGEVLAKPDIGMFSFSVRAEGDDATTAQNLSAESINGIIEYLKGEGVDEKDIKTAYYNLNPRYRYDEQVCTFGSYCPPTEPIMDGFEVNQTIEVKVRDLEKAGSLISGAGERGATNISGLTFTIDDTDELKAEARQQAIAAANEKAEALAESLGVRIIRMTGFWEDEGYYPMYDGGYGGDMAAFEERAAVAPSVPTGENTVTSRVNISYEVR